MKALPFAPDLMSMIRAFVGSLLITAILPPLSAEPLPAEFFRNLQSGKKQTIVVYGTSLSHTAEWPKELKRYFDKEFAGQVTVVNAASSGKESRWGLANLEKRVLSARPDLVFLEFSMNDSARKHGISTKQSEENLDVIVHALREQNPRVEIILQTMNPSWNTPQDPGTTAASDRPDLADYYEVYRRYAREKKLPLVDHERAWEKLRGENREQFERWLPDGTHPVSEGSLAVTWAGIKVLLERANSKVEPKAAESVE